MGTHAQEGLRCLDAAQSFYDLAMGAVPNWELAEWHLALAQFKASLAQAHFAAGRGD